MDCNRLDVLLLLRSTLYFHPLFFYSSWIQANSLKLKIRAFLSFQKSVLYDQRVQSFPGVARYDSEVGLHLMKRVGLRHGRQKGHWVLSSGKFFLNAHRVSAMSKKVEDSSSFLQGRDKQHCWANNLSPRAYNKVYFGKNLHFDCVLTSKMSVKVGCWPQDLCSMTWVCRIFVISIELPRDLVGNL